MQHLTDDEIIKRCLRHNTDAGKELFIRYALFLQRLSYRTTLNSSVAEEICQETWLRVFQKLHQYQTGTSFKSWAASICYHLCVDHIRKAQHHKNLDAITLKQLLYPIKLIPIELAEQNEWMGKILQYLQSMPETFRTAFTLRYIEEMNYQEIAGIMDCPVKTARTRVFRVTETLRAQFCAQQGACP